MSMMTKGCPCKRIVKGLFFLGLLGLFFTLEVTHPLQPRMSRKRSHYAPIRGYLGLQALMPAVAETGDVNDAYGEWQGLPGPFLEDIGPGDGNLFAEPEASHGADRSAFSFPISRSPPVSLPGQ